MKVKIGLDRLRCFIVIRGFEVCQWSLDHPSVDSHMPPEARSESSELWLSQGTTDQHESTLGLRCQTPFSTNTDLPWIAMLQRCNGGYRILASQYDPLGFILPFNKRVIVLEKDLSCKQT